MLNLIPSGFDAVKKVVGTVSEYIPGLSSKKEKVAGESESLFEKAMLIVKGIFDKLKSLWGEKEEVSKKTDKKVKGTLDQMLAIDTSGLEGKTKEVFEKFQASMLVGVKNEQLKGRESDIISAKEKLVKAKEGKVEDLTYEEASAFLAGSMFGLAELKKQYPDGDEFRMALTTVDEAFQKTGNPIDEFLRVANLKGFMLGGTMNASAYLKPLGMGMTDLPKLLPMTQANLSNQDKEEIADLMRRKALANTEEDKVKRIVEIIHSHTSRKAEEIDKKDFIEMLSLVNERDFQALAKLLVGKKNIK